MTRLTTILPFCILFLSIICHITNAGKQLQLSGFAIENEINIDTYLKTSPIKPIWIASYDGQSWLYYNPKLPNHYKNKLKNIKPGLGYWILSSDEVKTNKISLTQPLHILKPGFALVYPSVSSSIELTQALNSKTISSTNED
ncbi:hypothetical protein MJH12_10925, partial [bacterium]|nr:hypothetical protein [bacterium]